MTEGLTEYYVVTLLLSQCLNYHFHHHFFKSHFCRPTQAETVIFRGQFLGGRAGPGRAGSGRVAY